MRGAPECALPRLQFGIGAGLRGIKPEILGRGWRDALSGKACWQATGHGGSGNGQREQG